MDNIRKVAVLMIFFIKIEELLAECTFPDFLRRPLPNGEERHWITQTKYLGFAPNWEKQVEITVKPHEIVARVKKQAQCSSPGYGRRQNCSHKEVKYRLKCVEEERDGKYRVLKIDHQNGGRDDYRCYKFKEHNKNVIQIWKSANSEQDMEFLCSAYSMMRDEWIWVAPKQEEWVSCPMSGGYDFTSYRITPIDSYHTDDDEKYCPNVWRPSRLESECIRGEGIMMEFPHQDCSPFYKNPKQVQLLCWAWWKEGDVSFVVLSEANKLPQFVLRHPSYPANSGPFVAYFYFSPLIPMNSQRMPNDGYAPSVGMVKMVITKSEPGDGLCYDESSHCSTYARDGKCKNSALHQYANYCKKSCGMCDLLPSISAECHFPLEVRMMWFYFLNEKPEFVNIRDGNITFSTIGTFVCKGISIAKNFNRYYKMMSYYNNGCRPRYTCFELGQEVDNVVTFRMSKSNLTDESFDLCKFEDDPFPIGNKIRSNKMKTLLPESLTTFNNCELQGRIKVQTEPLDRNCHGTLSDWDSHECKLGNIMKMKLHRHCHYLSGHSTVYREFTCIASVRIDEGYNLLYTREVANNNKFTCWVIGTYAEHMSYRLWRTASQLNNSDCASSYTFVMNPVISLKALPEKKQQPCNSMSTPKPISGYPGKSNGHGERPKIYIIDRIRDRKGLGSRHHSSIVVTISCLIIGILIKFEVR